MKTSSLKELAREERRNTGRDPDTLSWPACMEDKVIMIRNHPHICAKHFCRVEEPVTSPRRTPCRTCGALVPMTRTVSRAWYDIDSQRPYAEFVSSQTQHCGQCGDKAEEILIWKIKPSNWDTIVWPEHDAEPPPVEVARVPEKDPEADG